MRYSTDPVTVNPMNPIWSDSVIQGAKLESIDIMKTEDLALYKASDPKLEYNANSRNSKWQALVKYCDLKGIKTMK